MKCCGDCRSFDVSGEAEGAKRPCRRFPQVVYKLPHEWCDEFKEKLTVKPAVKQN